MEDVVQRALTVHQEETGHGIRFKEVWTYDLWDRSPHLDQSDPERYVVILHGATRFEQAHAAIQYPDGRRYMVGLKMSPLTVPFDQQEGVLIHGKLKQVRWPGGAYVAPETSQPERIRE